MPYLSNEECLELLKQYDVECKIKERKDDAIAMVSLKREKEIGSIVLFGTGGPLRNELKDLSFRRIPAERAELETMVKETRIYQMFIETKDRMLEKIIDILTNLVKLLEDDFRITSIVIDSLILSSNPYAEDVKIEVRDL